MLWERRGGEGRDGVFEKDRNVVGRLNSFSLWMWWEYTHDHLHSAVARQERSHCNVHRGDEKDHRRDVVEGVKDSTSTGKRLQWDGMKSSTAVGSNPWERWTGRGGRWSAMIMGSGSRVFNFFLAGINPSPIVTNGCLMGGQTINIGTNFRCRVGNGSPPSHIKFFLPIFINYYVFPIHSLL
jgi:hypothetical protein